MRLNGMIKLFAFSLLLLGVPAIASAQWGNNRNGGYYNGALESTIKRVKDQSKSFERAVDRSNYKYMENLAKDFKKAADKLEDKFDNGRNMNKSYNEASRLIQLGQQIDRQLGSNNNNRNRNSGYGNYNDFYQWNQISNDLRMIADAYGIRYNNNGRWNDNNNRRGRGNNNGRINIPWPF